MHQNLQNIILKWIGNRSIENFLIQSHIKYLQSEIDEMEKVMSDWSKECGTDKYNGQLEYFVEKKKQEIINAEKLIK
jgi:hypothetical protein